MKRFKYIVVSIFFGGLLLFLVWPAFVGAYVSDVFDFPVDGQAGWAADNSRCLWAGTNANNTGVPYDDSWACNPRSSAANGPIKIQNQDLQMTTTITNVYSIVVDYGYVSHDDYPAGGTGIIGKALNVHIQCRGNTYYADQFVIDAVTGNVEFDIDYGFDDPCPWSNDLASNTTYIFVDSLHNGSNVNAGMSIWRVELIGDALVPPAPTPTLPPYAGSCSFTITDTQILTDEFGITSTIEITQSYTVSSNLLSNYSFEDGLSPWETVVNGGFQTVSGWRVYDAAHTGQYSARNVGPYNVNEFSLIQAMGLYTSGTYAAGVHVSCLTDDCDSGQSVSVRVAGYTVASETGGTISSTWHMVSGTHETGGGAGAFEIVLSGYLGDVRIDDAFMYPSDENGNLNCNSAFYPPPPTTTVIVPPPDIIPNPWSDPIPIPRGDPSDVTCYLCSVPTNPFEIGAWIAYLGCLLKNLFQCSLRIWLYNVVNAVMGLWQYLLSLINWLYLSAQNIFSWVSGVIVSWWNYIMDIVTNLWQALPEIPRKLLIYVFESELVQSIWQSYEWVRVWWSIMVWLVRALIAIINDLGQAIVALIQFMLETFNEIKTAFSTISYEIVLITDDGQTINAILPDELFAAGPNLTKVLWLFLSSISTFDMIVGLYRFEIVLLIAVGGLAIIVFFWTMKFWEKIIPN